MPVTKNTKFGPVVFESEEHYQNYLKQADDNSHQKALADKPMIGHIRAVETSEGKVVGELDEASARQHMRRQGAMEKLVQDTLLTRVQPGSGANVEHISFEQWQELNRDYQEARQSGESVAEATRRVGFQPMSEYLNKIQRRQPDGGVKSIRPLLMNEVGIRPDGKILCLQDRMPGDVGTVVVGAHRGRPQE